MTMPTDTNKPNTTDNRAEMHSVKPETCSMQVPPVPPSPPHTHHQRPGLHEPPHHAPGSHKPKIPPHHKSSLIKVGFDDNVIIDEVFGAGFEEFIERVLDRCPPEMKMTLGLALGGQVDLSSLPNYGDEMSVGFESGFLDDHTLGLLQKASGCSSEELLAVYGSAPPEVVIMAIMLAYKKVKEQIDESE